MKVSMDQDSRTRFILRYMGHLIWGRQDIIYSANALNNRHSDLLVLSKTGRICTQAELNYKKYEKKKRPERKR